jgi:hypothetical protein
MHYLYTLHTLSIYPPPYSYLQVLAHRTQIDRVPLSQLGIKLLLLLLLPLLLALCRTRVPSEQFIVAHGIVQLEKLPKGEGRMGMGEVRGMGGIGGDEEG